MTRYILIFLVFLWLPFDVYSQTILEGADGETVRITETSRIITIGGSVTETVFALGAGERVIAVDESSTWPAPVRDLPKVPYVRTLSAEGILGLNPTLIIASEEASPRTAITHIRSAGVPVLIVPDRPSLENVAAKIQLISRALGLEETAGKLIETFDSDIEQAQQLRGELQTSPRVMFLLSAAEGQHTFMAAGTESSAETMIELAGGENIFDSFNGYKPVSPEAVAAANPEFIVMMSNRGDIDGGANPSSMPGIRLTDAAKNDRFITMDGNYLLGFGPRTGQAVLELMNRLHPGELTVTE